MSIQNMNDLFVHTLKDIHYAENQILKALPKMSKKASSPELKAAFDAHLAETKGQVERLKDVFKLVGEKPAGETCPAIKGIIEEASELMEEIEDTNTLDAAMIAAAQAVEHYEITRYGTLASWAGELGMNEAAALLEETLAEEKATDLKLTELGESRINAMAIDGDDAGEASDGNARAGARAKASTAKPRKKAAA